MCTSKANQAFTPADEQFTPLGFFFKHADRTEIVTNVVANQAMHGPIFRFGIGFVVRSFDAYTHDRLEPKDLQPTRALDGDAANVFQSSGLAEKPIFIQVATDCQFHVTIAAPIFPSLAKMFEKFEHRSRPIRVSVGKGADEATLLSRQLASLGRSLDWQIKVTRQISPNGVNVVCGVA